VNVLGDLIHVIINPANHILLKIDDTYIMEWGKNKGWIEKLPEYHDNLVCIPTIIKKNISESQVLERLKCVSNNFFIGGEFFHKLCYNCGGFIHDVSNIAGLGIPGLSNFGVGSDFRNRKWTEEAVKGIEKICDRHMDNLRAVMELLGRGKFEIDSQLMKRIMDLLKMPSPDLLMQFISLASKNEKIRDFVLISTSINPLMTERMAEMVYEKAVGKGIFPAQKARKKTFKEIFSNIPPDGMDWIRLHFPKIHKLIGNIKNKK
jgi:hypothetical protein